MNVVTRGARRDSRLVSCGPATLTELKRRAHKAHRRHVNRTLTTIAQDPGRFMVYNHAFEVDLGFAERDGWEMDSDVDFRPLPRHRVTGWDVC